MVFGAQPDRWRLHMDPPGAWLRFCVGVLVGLMLPTAVSLANDAPELFAAPGLGTAPGVAIVAIAGLALSGWRMFAFGALLGSALYYPFAVWWAVGQGMSLGG